MKRLLKIKCTLFIIVITVLVISLSPVALAMDEETAQEIIDQWKQEGNIDERGGVYVDTQFSRIYYDNTLYALWDIYGFPADVGGIFYDKDSGMMGFLLVEPTSERIAELRRLAVVEIVVDSSKYSWNELLRVQSEITSLMTQDFDISENNPDLFNDESGIYFSATGWTNTDGVVHGFGENRKEMRVTVGVDESMYDYYNELFAKLYGDMVVVMVSEPVMPGFAGMDDLLMEGGADAWGNDFLDTLVTVDSIPDVIILFDDSNTSLTLFIVLGFGLLGMITTLLLIRVRRISAMQTTSEDIITEGKPNNREQVVAAVKESGNVPRDNLFKAIVTKINNSGRK